MRNKLYSSVILGIVGLLGCAEPDSDVAATELTSTDAQDQASEAPVVLQQTSAPTCSGKAGRLRGKSIQKVNAGGLNRSFVYYAPTNLDPNQPAPLVIVPHGYTMSGQQMFDITQYAALADREGFIAVFPDGGPGAGPWNVGSGICGAGSFVNGGNNDQAFVNAMIDFAKADQCIDSNHVFMNGFSMGGYFSNETGCLNPNVKAISPHSGGTHDLGRCVQRKLPVLIQHFQPDNLIAYNCGTGARDRWVKRNGCSLAAPDVEIVQNGRCEYYKGCQNGQVAMCTYKRTPQSGELISGHGWAGGAKGGQGGGFAVAGTASATDVAWSFFKKYAW